MIRRTITIKQWRFVIMKVKSMIEKLSQLDPEAECAVFIGEDKEVYEVTGAHQIESGLDNEVEIVSIDVKGVIRHFQTT